MEDRSMKCVLGNRPPISPKSFTPIPSSMDTGSSFEGWQKPYFMTHDGAGSSGTNLPHPEPFYGLITCPPSADVTSKKTQIPTPLSRNPITDVAPSSAKSGGITVKTEQGIDYEMRWGHNMDPNMDAKRIRRILSNRISAQKSRLRKLQYVNEMEKKAKDLQAEISGLTPLIESEKDQHKMLRMENSILKEKMSIYENTTKLSLAAIQERRSVVKRLRELYAAQQRMNIQEEALKLSWNSTGMEQMANFSSYECGPQPMESLDSNQGELDPALNFKSLTIDPPKSLM